jgi:endonuclease III
MAKRTIRDRDLGIDLESGTESEYFKWFLACLLFGKSIQQEVAKRACLEFVREELITPEALIEAGWDRLVSVLDHGHYVRFDFSTTTKLLGISQSLMTRYGSLTNLFRQSSDRRDLAKRLQEFKGVGPVTTRIFLYDIKPL